MTQLPLIAAQWWADHLRRIPNSSRPTQPLPRQSSHVRMTNIPAVNVAIDGAKLNPDLIDAYERILAGLIDELLKSDTTQHEISEQLRVTHKPSAIHEEAMWSAGFHPSMTLLPWGSRMWIDRDKQTILATAGSGLPVYRIHPNPEAYETPRLPRGHHERRIRAHRIKPID